MALLLFWSEFAEAGREWHWKERNLTEWTVLLSVHTTFSSPVQKPKLRIAATYSTEGQCRWGVTVSVILGHFSQTLQLICACQRGCALTSFVHLCRCVRILLLSFQPADVFPPPSHRPELGFSSAAYLACLAGPNTSSQVPVYDHLLDHCISARGPVVVQWLLPRLRKVTEKQVVVMWCECPARISSFLLGNLRSWCARYPVASIFLTSSCQMPHNISLPPPPKKRKNISASYFYAVVSDNVFSEGEWECISSESVTLSYVHATPCMNSQVHSWQT